MEFGDLDNLRILHLSENRLSGDIPKELANLADTLTHRRLAGNQITGFVSVGLATVADNDMSELGLTVCSDS